MARFVGIGGLWCGCWRRLGSSTPVGCGVVGVLWVTGFNMEFVWVGLWVYWCVCGGGSGGFRGGGCGCCLVGWVGVGLVDFFFLCYRL